MVNNFPSFQYFYKIDSRQLDIVLPGLSDGISLFLIQQVIALSREQGQSVLAFDYLFFERGETQSSGLGLLEEQKTLTDLMNFVWADEFDQIRFIGKSLGGIVASYFLKSIPKEETKKYSIIVLGYVKQYIDLKTFPGKIVFVQGEKDKNGGIEEVKKHMQGAVSQDITYFEIPGASHGFSDPETKKPLYYNQVIEALRKL
jgi:alpha/beta superfamily hydrolase